MPLCPPELIYVYELLDSTGLHTTIDLARAPRETEIEFVRRLVAPWDNDVVEPIRNSTARKFALYLDSPVTELVIKHSSSYADYSFFVTPAVSGLGTPESQGFYLAPQSPNDWIPGRDYRFPSGLVETLHAVRPMVERGHAMVLPTWIDGSGIGRGQVSYQWPVIRDRHTIDVNLTRFREINPLLYAGQHPAAFLELSVPVLVGVSLEVVQRVREEERDAFERFTKRFFGMVKENEDRLESEEALADAICQVDDAVRELEERYQSIRRSRTRGLGEAGVALGLTCLCLFLPPDVSKFLAALFGGKAGTTGYHAFGRYHESMDDLRSEDFYVPWLIAHEGGGLASLSG